MQTIKLIIALLPSIVATSIYSYFVMPIGWDKWMNSHNYAAGDFGKFLVFSPLIIGLICVGVQAQLWAWWDKRRMSK